MSALKKYRHFPLDQAIKDCSKGEKERYKIVTINWTFAKNGKYDQVHRNEYSFTLRNLIKFIRETYEVAEDIISVKREK